MYVINRHYHEHEVMVKKKEKGEKNIGRSKQVLKLKGRSQMKRISVKPGCENKNATLVYVYVVIITHRHL